MERLRAEAIVSDPGVAVSDAVVTSAVSADNMTDLQFDELLPTEVKRASSIFWTPVAVARRAADLFQSLGARRVLDVGSGPGKFAIVAGARTPNIRYVGVEHRPQLAAIARALCALVGTANVTFSTGDTTRIPWTEFDAFYVYNSFAENSFDPEYQFDCTVELSHSRYVAESKRVAERLSLAAEGSVIVTYHGMGAPIPSSYEMMRTEAAGTGWLRAWRKGGAVSDDRYWVEQGSDVSCWSAAPAHAIGVKALEP